MIEINTRDFGIIEVEEKAIYHFPEGVYGFEDDTKFAIFERAFDDVSFLFLQSVLNAIPCFLVFEPWNLYPEFRPIISNEDLKDLEVDNIDNLVFLLIASIPTTVEKLSINLKSPIVLNPKTKKARQIILKNREYPVRFYPFLFDEEGGASC